MARDPRLLPGPESLGDLVAASCPAVDPTGSRVFYVVTRVDLENDTYVNTVWAVDATGERRILQSGPSTLCPAPGPRGERYLYVARVVDEKRRKRLEELRLATIYGSGSQLLMRAPYIAQPRWSPDGRLAAVLAAVGEPERDVKVVDDIPYWFNGRGWVHRTTVRPFLLDPEAGAAAEIPLAGRSEWLEAHSLAWSPDGGKLAITVSRDRRRPYLYDLVVYDLGEGEARTLATGFAGAAAVAWSPDGRWVAVLGHRLERGLSTHNRVYLVDAETGETGCATCMLDRNHVGTVNSDARGPRRCSPLLQWTEEGVLFIASSQGRQLLMAYRPGVDEEPRVLVDPGEGSVDEFSASRSGKTIAYTAMSMTELKDLYLLRAGAVERVTGHAEAWRRKYRAPQVEEVVFTASDGEELQGWILRPPEGVEERGWVLYIHGGPKTMWGYGFMHEHHVLAARGYTVALLNPRGSDGYSNEFADIRCRYGERDLEDLVEYTEWLTREKGLPGDRAAVMGGSYGGYMTNMVITRRPGLFRAAVSMRGISNWETMYTLSDIGWYFVEDQLCCSPWRGRDRCWEKSPLRDAAKVEAPVLLIHSAQDYRTPLDQALQFFTALRLHGKEARLAVFPQENHDLSRTGRPRHRLERLKLILEWLDKHLAGKTGEGAAGGAREA